MSRSPPPCRAARASTFSPEPFRGAFFDIGIAEQHAFAAGLAAEALKPFCALYPTFLQRGYEGAMAPEPPPDFIRRPRPATVALNPTEAVALKSPQAKT